MAQQESSGILLTVRGLGAIRPQRGSIDLASAWTRDALVDSATWLCFAEESASLHIESTCRKATPVSLTAALRNFLPPQNQKQIRRGGIFSLILCGSFSTLCEVHVIYSVSKIHIFRFNISR